MHGRRGIMLGGCVLGLVALAGATGCVGKSPRRDRGARERVGPEAFATEPAQTPEVTKVEQAAETTPPPASGELPAFGAEPVVVRSAVPATLEKPEPAAPAGLELVEAKVGDINGMPIYVSSFFEPIEDRLTAEAQRLRPADWRREAAKIIAPRLDGMIADELLRAEALAALTTQQRQGLRAFLSNFRRDIITESAGSAQLANRRLEAGGQSLDKALQQKETDTLVALTLFQEVNKRVNVSWRDIRQRYERDLKDYNPPPTASFRLIRVRTDNEEGLTRVTRLLGEGEAFEGVASDEANTFRRDDGGQVRSPFEGDFKQGEFFAAPELNEKARALGEGEVTGPFELGQFTCWLKLEGVEQESISLYDAQLKINQELTLERRRDEQTRYLSRLIERARVSNRDEILLRLLSVAEERYGPKS